MKGPFTCNLWSLIKTDWHVRRGLDQSQQKFKNLKESWFLPIEYFFVFCRNLFLPGRVSSYAGEFMFAIFRKSRFWRGRRFLEEVTFTDWILSVFVGIGLVQFIAGLHVTSQRPCWWRGRKNWSTSKGGPVFSKLFRLDRTDPLSFGAVVFQLNLK